MKRLLSLTLVLCMVLSLAACGGTSASSSSTAPTSSVNDAGAGTPDPSSDGPVGADLDWLNGNTITIVCPFAAGGSLDLMLRAFLPYWEQEAGCTFVVENREGAGSVAGTTYFTTVKQDMQTIYSGTQTYFSAGPIVNGATYRPEDFKLINMQQMDPTTLTVLQSSPYNTAEELIQAIKDNPGQLKCGCVAGAAGIIMMGMLQDAYDLDFKVITYDSGNDFRTALLGGHVDFIPGSANGDMGLGDQAKVLTVCGSERNLIWPDTPCTDEVWPELSIPASLGSCRFVAVGAQAAADYPERFQALVETYEKAFQNPDYQKSLEASGELYVSGYYGPEESDSLNNSLHAIIEQYKEFLAE